MLAPFPGSKFKRLLAISLIIFAVALLIRVLYWQDNRREALRVQTYVTYGYKDSASQLLRGDTRTFLSDINHLGHPPGYSILLAGIFRIFGNSDTAVQLLQVVCDSIAVVLLFLIGSELVSLPIAVTAGLLAALSPQFSYFSILVLPDSLVALPLLLATYLVVRGRTDRTLTRFVLAGSLVGLSCWLRANALLLAPFLGLATALFVKQRPTAHVAAVILGAVVLVAPITIRNAIIFHRFIPLSLGAGQTLLEGLSDYDEDHKTNIPKTDLGLMRQEADWYGKPEYASVLFGRDGIDRDRLRLKRGIKVIAAHPFWFAGVMVRRAVGATRLDPVPRLAAESPVSHKFDRIQTADLVWTKKALQFPFSQVSMGANMTVVDDKWLRVVGDEHKYGDQVSSEIIQVTPLHDYVLRWPLRLENGRTLVRIVETTHNATLASINIDADEGVAPPNQAEKTISVPFVSANNSQIRIAVANNAASQPVVYLGQPELFDLGHSSLQGLRYLRIPIRFMQRFFVTAWILPLVILGIILMIRARQFQTLAIILVIPVYYLVVQSALHTERRYIYVIHFFLLIPVSVSLYWLATSGHASMVRLKSKLQRPSMSGAGVRRR